MSAKWKKEFEPKIILDKISAIRIIEGDSVSFRGFEYDEYIQVLKSMIEISDELSTEVKLNIILNGFHEAAKIKNMNAESVISSINKTIRMHQEKPNKKFILITTINISSQNDLPRTTINNCIIEFHKTLPNKFKESRSKAIEDVSSWLIKKDEDQCTFLSIKVESKDMHDATEKALDAIDLMRGIWNLIINKTMVISFGGRKAPINQITLGALHTLHNTDGTIDSSTYWYEVNHHKDHKRVDLSKNSYQTLKAANKILKKTKSSKYKKDIQSAIIRYTRALDSNDYNDSFIKLWGILEFLTSTLHDSYDKTIKRTIFQYSDRAYNKQVLEHLRQYRNKSVHSGSGYNNIETSLYQLKNYVERLLRFHISNHFNFDSLQESAQFMDLNPDPAILKKQISLYKAGIKFITG